MKITAKFIIGLGVLILLSPLGLIIPDHFKTRDAWGEWGADKFKELAGYVPNGLEKLSSFWKAPFPDYSFKGWEEKGLTWLSLAYIFSALLGVVIIFLAVMLIGKLLVKKGE